MKEQTVARYTGLTFLLMGIVAIIFAVLGIAGMLMYGGQFGAFAAMPGGEAIGMMLLVMWVILIVELIIGIFSLIAGIGWLKYKFETAAA
jgi:uncharacterized membrane protein